MKTLAVTTARQKLGYWLKRALAGEEIGIVMDGQVIGLRPVEVIRSDYALQEYGVSEQTTNGFHAALYTGGGLVDVRKIESQSAATHDSVFRGIAQVQEALLPTELPKRLKGVNVVPLSSLLRRPPV